MKKWEKFFSENGEWDFGNGYDKSFTVEDIYQAFRRRLQEDPFIMLPRFSKPVKEAIETACDYIEQVPDDRMIMNIPEETKDIIVGILRQVLE
jgi:hypothetical protein